MKHLLLVLFLLPLITQGETLVYKGTVGSRKVTLWLSDDFGCGPGQYNAMYRYEGMSKWLLLAAAQNGQGNYCMTESRFTGVLLLTRNKASFTGYWLSPDRRKQLPVTLRAAPADAATLNGMHEQYNKVQEEQDDC